ncbi:hypothetical protein D3C81_1593770 [compost metagenome]
MIDAVRGQHGVTHATPVLWLGKAPDGPVSLCHALAEQALAVRRVHGCKGRVPARHIPDGVHHGGAESPLRAGGQCVEARCLHYLASSGLGELRNPARYLLGGAQAIGAPAVEAADQLIEAQAGALRHTTIPGTSWV